jgi:hypothetical protein
LGAHGHPVQVPELVDLLPMFAKLRRIVINTSPPLASGATVFGWSLISNWTESTMLGNFALLGTSTLSVVRTCLAVTPPKLRLCNPAISRIPYAKPISCRRLATASTHESQRSENVAASATPAASTQSAPKNAATKDETVRSRRVRTQTEACFRV